MDQKNTKKYKKYNDIQRPGKENEPGADWRNIQSRKWFITVWQNEYTKNIQKWIKKTKHYMLAKETGTLSGKEHDHIYLEFSSPRKLGDLRDSLGEGDYERAKGNHTQVFNYLKKDGKYEHNLILPEEVKIIEELYPWQKEIVDEIGTLDDRQIRWVYDEKGNKGKTALLKWLIVKQKALIVGGTYKDIINGLDYYVEENKNVYPKIIVMNLARDNEKVSYSGLESLKDGLCVNTKYKCRQHVFNPPHVIVMANCEPEYTRMSKGRFKVMVL